MSENARETTIAEALDTAGLDEIFSCHDKVGQEDLTLEEASARLNLSERTIQRRLKRGQIKGYKIPGPRGPEWRICSESWQDTPQEPIPSSDDTTVVEFLSTVDTTPPHDSILIDKSGEVRQPEPSPAPKDNEDYKTQLIQELQAKLEGASYRIGYLEAQSEIFQKEIKLLTDSQHKVGWWSRFCSWFTSSGGATNGS